MMKKLTLLSILFVANKTYAQGEEATSIMIEALLIYIVIAIAVFLLMRPIWLWYFKINERLQEEQERTKLLRKIYEIIKPKEQKREVKVFEKEESVNDPELLENLIEKLSDDKDPT